jgi:hypothetical protein
MLDIERHGSGEAVLCAKSVKNKNFEKMELA